MVVENQSIAQYKGIKTCNIILVRVDNNVKAVGFADDWFVSVCEETAGRKKKSFLNTLHYFPSLFCLFLISDQAISIFLKLMWLRNIFNLITIQPRLLPYNLQEILHQNITQAARNSGVILILIWIIRIKSNLLLHPGPATIEDTEV